MSHMKGVKSAKVTAPRTVEVVTLPRVRTIAPKSAIARAEACDALRAADPTLQFTGPDLQVTLTSQSADSSRMTFTVTLP